MLHKKWRPQRESNPRFGLERAASWAAGRWGRTEGTPNLSILLRYAAIAQRVASRPELRARQFKYQVLSTKDFEDQYRNIGFPSMSRTLGR